MNKIIEFLFALGFHRGQKHKIEIVPVKEFIKRIVFVYIVNFFSLLPYAIYSLFIIHQAEPNVNNTMRVIHLINTLLCMGVYLFLYRLNKNNAKLAFLISSTISVITGIIVCFLA